VRVTGRATLMNNESIAINRSTHEERVTERFLDAPDELSFADLFRVFTPQLLAFFRTRGCGSAVAEDLAQEVMLTVHLKASQLRERKLFRAWLFKIARNALSHYYRKQAAEVATVDLADIADRLAASHMPARCFRSMMCESIARPRPSRRAELTRGFGTIHFPSRRLFNRADPPGAVSCRLGYW